jgi:hypothetical protein
MINLTDKLIKDCMDLLVAKGATNCDAMSFIHEHPNCETLTIEECLPIIESNEFRPSWCFWFLCHFTRDDIDNSVFKSCVRRLSRVPNYALKTYLLDLSTVDDDDEELLLQSFHSKYRSDGVKLFHQLEKEMEMGQAKLPRRGLRE